MYMYAHYYILTEVGVSFNQSSYRANETSCVVQIGLFLTSPLPNEINVTVRNRDASATSK